MYVIRLPNGNLRVPHSAVFTEAGADAEADAGTGGGGDIGRIIAQGYVEIGPEDPDYDRLSDEALTEEELEDKRREWRAGDAAVLRLFEEWKAERPEAGGTDAERPDA